MLIADCMRSRSYYFHIPRLPIPLAGASVPNAYGLISIPTAARQGYGIAASIPLEMKDGQIGSELPPDAHHPGFTRALIGTPSAARSIPLPGGSQVKFNANGCSTIAVNKLYGRSWDTVYYTVSALVFRIVTKVEASRTWADAASAWSRCVHESYSTSFPNPSAAEASVRNAASAQLAGLSSARFAERLKLVRANEIRLATIDARCQAKSGLPAAASKAQHIAELPYEKKYAADLQAYAADLHHAVQATDVLLSQR